LDWGGGLVWVTAEPSISNHTAISAAVKSQGGTATIFRAPDALRLAVPVLPETNIALGRIEKRVKDALDPLGLFNPGHFRPMGSSLVT
jgi:glycolate oxidase FAD binding subunit